ncbi:hypothetical protein SEA_THUNDERCLAP_45 [Arthrobacter phage Thunderclap]|uniref:Uncharacterized protein n=10 Tax=Amigovirus amigo TaxID=1982100 RepID=A0A0U3TM50_9CAUD|nr:hypothetical protein FDH66_gp58 [Arthrobacter phage Amigo]ALY08490.1 hypothetical protein ANANSI_45 [Arthrobacter phage Anansi]ALY09104.1 hypothetical protein GORGEOUS_45 [Arthrobacter phage Gorgeous]ALY10121.1 hypothetical protein RINGS_44 [Arthrobacter phage Rings]ALY10385.1 hypothetical protein SORJUANA_45 [Arthrobacter phage SorJuana]QFG08339.1 hypothetical protein SEA_YEEZUS_44 [Arthrobacter phage Yeezus]QFG13387.1 hypothetical protein SEA_ICHOR_44 [Arthrobacter phage Ichor]QFG13905.
MSEKMRFSEELAKTNGVSVAPKNRVELLLEDLAANDPENYTALLEALKETTNTNAAITRTIRKVWGQKAVTDTSVREYRHRNGFI